MKSKRLAALGLAALITAGTLAAERAPSAATSFDTHTEPSRQAKVSFAQSGVVSQVFVKDGDPVKAGDPLAKLDDRGEIAALDSMELEAKSNHKIEAAQADLEEKKVLLERIKDMFAHDAAGRSELDEATVNVKIREIQVSLEETTQKQKVKDAEHQAVKVEQMTIRAPFDGVIQKIDFEVGEIPDAQQQKSVTVVKNDSVWINVFIPTATALKLKLGDSLAVRYKDSGEEAKGKVIHLAPVADAASDTRLVRVEVPNPKGLPAGLAVTVSVDSVATR